MLASEPRLLLLDEPLADLDPVAADEIMGLLRELADEGRTVVVVVHTLELAGTYATRMVVVDDFRVVADGSPEVAQRAAYELFATKARPAKEPDLTDSTARNPLIA